MKIARTTLTSSRKPRQHVPFKRIEYYVVIKNAPCPLSIELLDEVTGQGTSYTQRGDRLIVITKTREKAKKIAERYNATERTQDSFAWHTSLCPRSLRHPPPSSEVDFWRSPCFIPGGEVRLADDCVMTIHP